MMGNYEVSSPRFDQSFLIWHLHFLTLSVPHKNSDKTYGRQYLVPSTTQIEVSFLEYSKTG